MSDFRRYSKEDDQFIIRNNSVMKKREIGECLGRSEYSILRRLKILRRRYQDDPIVYDMLTTAESDVKHKDDPFEDIPLQLRIIGRVQRYSALSPSLTNRD